MSGCFRSLLPSILRIHIDRTHCKSSHQPIYNQGATRFLRNTDTKRLIKNQRATLNLALSDHFVFDGHTLSISVKLYLLRSRNLQIAESEKSKLLEMKELAIKQLVVMILSEERTKPSGMWKAWFRTLFISCLKTNLL